MAQANKWKRHLNAADRRAKIIIQSCVESGAEIEFIADAPRFRYTPLHMLVESARKGTSFKPAHDNNRNLGPSKRSSTPCGSNPLKLKTWSPCKLDANPMYSVPMTGDDYKLTKARSAWANGDPTLLREYLAQQAEAQKLEPAPTHQLELMEAA